MKRAPSQEDCRGEPWQVPLLFFNRGAPHSLSLALIPHSISERGGIITGRPPSPVAMASETKARRMCF